MQDKGQTWPNGSVDWVDKSEDGVLKFGSKLGKFFGDLFSDDPAEAAPADAAAAAPADAAAAPAGEAAESEETISEPAAAAPAAFFFF